MIVTKPADFRMNQKDFFQKAYEGETVIISRPRNENVVMISEKEYNKLLREKRLMMYFLGLKTSGRLNDEEESIAAEGIYGALGGEVIKMYPKDKEDYLERIDRSLKELEEGKTMDAKKALELICSEIHRESEDY